MIFFSWIDRANIAIGKLVSYLIWVGIAIVAGEVILRYVFGAPSVWGPAYTQRIFAVYFVLLGAFTLTQGGHVRVDLLLNSPSPRRNAFLDLFNYVVLVIWGAALAYEAWHYLAESWMYNERDDSALGHPMWPIKLALLVGTVLITLQGTVEIIRSSILVIRPDADVRRQVQA